MGTLTSAICDHPDWKKPQKICYNYLEFEPSSKSELSTSVLLTHWTQRDLTDIFEVKVETVNLEGEEGDVCPYRTDDGIYSDHDYLDTLEIPPRTTLN